MKAILFLLLTLLLSVNIHSIGAEKRSCGIADIDKIRIELRIKPTNASNALSRRATLFRWWRLLWHQGYDMNMKNYDAVWNKLLINKGNNKAAYIAVNDAYAAMEDIMTNGIIIPEVEGTSVISESDNTTDWPGYHGTDGNHTGYSPDAGPSKGKIAWQVAKGNFWHATPVIEKGRVYVASPGTDCIAYCLDETTGEVIWNGRQMGLQVYTTPGSIFSPVVSSNSVLISTGWWQPDIHFVLNKKTGITEFRLPVGDISNDHSNEFMVYKYNRWNVIFADAATGKEIWKFESGGNLSGEPILDENRIFSVRQSGQVYRFNTDNNKPVWKQNLDAQLRGTPGVSDTQVYVGNTNRELIALHEFDGTTNWTFQTTEQESEHKAYQYFSTAVETTIPKLHNPKRVYVGAASGYVYCLNATNGELIWKYKVSDWVRSKPVVLGDKIYVATLDAKIFALRDTGESAEKLWQTRLGEHGFTADLVGNENGILASGMDLIIYSVSPSTGSIQWRHSLIDAAWIDGNRYQADVFAGQFQSSPVVVDNVVYIGGPDGFLNAHNVDTGERLWRFEARGRISSTPCVAEGKVFIGQNSQYMEYYAIDQKTGEPLWIIKDLGWATVGSTTFYNGKIFVGTESGRFLCIDADNGTILWEHHSKIPNQGFHTPPSVDDTKVYTGSHDGRYYALNHSDGSEAWSIDTSAKLNSISGGNPDSAGIVLWKDYVYLQKRGSRIAALKRDSGEEVWEWKQPANYLQNGAVAAHEDKIFGSVVRDVSSIPYFARIYAFNDKDHGGEKLWTYDESGGGGGLTSPVITDGKLFVGSSAGVFMNCLNLESGELIWRCYVGGPMEEGVPAIYGNKIFSHHRNGYFYAIE